MPVTKKSRLNGVIIDECERERINTGDKGKKKSNPEDESACLPDPSSRARCDNNRGSTRAQRGRQERGRKEDLI